MTAGQYDLTIEQGANLSLTLTWRDESNTLVNLTGYTARMMCRTAIGAQTAFLTLTTENGGISLGGAAGTIALSASAATTAGITASTGVYDLELVSGGGIVTRLLEGNVKVSKEVTR